MYTPIPPCPVRTYVPLICAQADHTIELNAEALSTGNLLAVTGTHHAHAEKTSGRIGEAFPAAGYGTFLVRAACARVTRSRLYSDPSYGL